MRAKSFKNYSYWVGLLFGTGILVTAISSYFAFFKYADHFGENLLVKYQEFKIGNREIDTIFVGDSSLGNAIDASYFSELSKLKAENLALSATYGIGGSYNMVKKAAKKHELKNVILMQTVRIWKGTPSYDGYLFTADSVFDLNLSELTVIFDIFLNLGAFSRLDRIMDILRSNPTKKNNSQATLQDPYLVFREHDYSPQADRVQKPNRTYRPFSHEVNTEKKKFLILLKDFCSKNKINLIVMHGPIDHRWGKKSQVYFNNINKFLNTLNLNTVQDIPLISNEDIGDDTDHVHYSVKQKYTEQYYQLLKNRLVY